DNGTHLGPHLFDGKGAVAIRFCQRLVERPHKAAPLLLVLLEQAQGRPDDLADIVIAAFGDAIAGELFKGRAEADVGRHELPMSKIDIKPYSTDAPPASYPRSATAAV